MTIHAVDETTELDQRLFMPWQKGFKLGGGYDFLAGKPMQSALSAVDSSPSTLSGRKLYVRYVRSQEDFEREVKGSLKASGEADGVQMSASVSFLSNAKYSSTQETLLISWYSDQDDFDEVKNPALSTAASQLLAGGIDTFRAQYGDYFISGGLRHAEFHAMYVLSAHDSSSLVKVEAAVQAKGGDIFSVDGSAAFTQTAATSGVSIMVFAEHTSAKESATAPKTLRGKDVQSSLTPTAVGELFEWFKQNAAGGYVVAELTHLSVLVPTFPREIKVPPTTLVNLSDLTTTLANCRRLHTSLPAHYRAQFDKELNGIEALAGSERQKLWRNPGALTGPLDSAEKLEAKMQAIVDFFDNVAHLRGHTNQLTGRDGGAIGIGEHGDTTKVPEGVEVHTTTLSARGTAVSGNITRSCEWSQPNLRIVHASVSSGWPRDQRGTCKHVNGDVGTGYLAAGFEADFDRGMSWSVEIKYVDFD
ncbi:hypothetical protein MK786_12150 [Microbacterium sp. CFH 31415]|uniref:hypothetical protein n=1 Tax=Microbacterium sp. CFH 31415 TaxID=2921732 RepID=UPI001F1400B1|nr:hypothetical protein [Microbacterium sp. CFH 31415]MCH6231494.1 hypothetical protein [Microbacterium sp. CFH 31415]